MKMTMPLLYALREINNDELKKIKIYFSIYFMSKRLMTIKTSPIEQ